MLPCCADFWGLKDASFLDNSEAVDKQHAASDDDVDEQIQHLKHQMLGDSIEGRWPAPPRPRRRKQDNAHERQGKKLEKRWSHVVNVWHKMDKNDDDKITKKEFIRTAGKRHSYVFKKMDSDHSGKLTFNEFKKNFSLLEPKHGTKASGKTRKQLAEEFFEAGKRVGEEKEIGKVVEIGEAAGDGSMTAEERAFRLEDQKEQRASEARAKTAAKKVQAAIKKIKQ